MIPVSTLLSRFGYAFPDCDEVEALEIAQKVYDEVHDGYPLRVTTKTVSLVDGTRTYDIAETTRRIWLAEYCTSAAAKTILTPVNGIDVLTKGSLYYTEEGTPAEYYLVGAVNGNDTEMHMGLYPVPNTTTTAGYPCVELTISQTQTLQTTTTLPEGFPDEEVMLAGMCCLYAERHNIETAQYWKSRKGEEYARLDKHYHSRAEGKGVQIIHESIRRRVTSVV